MDGVDSEAVVGQQGPCLTRHRISARTCQDVMQNAVSNLAPLTSNQQYAGVRYRSYSLMVALCT